MGMQIVRSVIKNHNQEQLEYFDEKIKKTMIPVDSYYVNRHVDKLIEYSGIERGDNILEVGCGMGKFTFPLLNRRFQITGLDLSPFLLKKLLEYNNNLFQVELICSDILSIDEQYNNTYDHVIGFFTLHHFQQLETYFQAMRRVLRPGGTISFIEPNAYNPLYYIQIAATPGMSWKGDKGVAMMRRKRFERAAEYAGMQLMGLKKYGFFPPFISNTSIGKQTELQLEKAKILNGVSAFQAIVLRNPG